MPGRILIADDHPPTVRLVREALEEAGYSVLTADNGAECLLAVHREQPDLLILDVIMPVMDGFQVLRVLREKEETRALPVIILSIRKSDRDILEGWKAGVDIYITKPFQVAEIVSAVNRILETGAGS